MILYWGNTCPHCEEVRQFIESQKITEKISLVETEVYGNQQNNYELIKAAKDCGLSTENIVVPLLYTQHRCFVGTSEIINYLSERAK